MWELKMTREMQGVAEELVMIIQKKKKKNKFALKNRVELLS